MSDHPSFAALVAELLAEFLETGEGQVAQCVIDLREQQSPYADVASAAAQRRADLVAALRKHINTN